jgi:hypothetical protein
LGRAAAGTKAALAAAKARGAKASRARRAQADARAADLAPIFARLDPNGSLSLNEMARRLTAEGLPTVTGSATWTAAVARIKARLVARV